MADWTDGVDPYPVAGALLRRDGAFGISDSAWAMHLLGLQELLPGTRYRSLTNCLPMLRAVKDPQALDRLAAAGERVIETGDAVVLDFGGLLGGYGSDTTRTVSVGPPSTVVQEVHEVVRRAQQAAFEAGRPGVTCQEIDRVARRVITQVGYGKEFLHRTGHGIGVTTHRLNNTDHRLATVQ